MSKFMAFAGTIAALSSLSFAWTITGIVSTEQGQPLPNVKITSTSIPNPNFQAISGEDGSFEVSTDIDLPYDGISPKSWVAKASVNFSHNVITVSNVKARTMTVSVMDALGKVCASKTQHNVDGSMIIDLNKTTAKGAKFLRINADGHRNTYKLGNTVSLLKEGDPLPTITFKLEGYKTTNYTMTKEVEEGVSIIMTAGSDEPESSSSVTEQVSSSSEAAPASSETVSSSSAEPEIDCSGKTLKANTELTIDGRKVIVKFPADFAGNKAVPMIINYHQIYGSAAGWAEESKIGQVALADGAISIYPDGVEGSMGQAWNVGPCCTTADDVQFTRDIIKEMTEKACVNPKRIYASGWSMGGGMTNYAGCVLSDVIAAGVSSAFDLSQEVLDGGQCNPTRGFPILNYRSTNDGVVNYNGGLSQIVAGMPITFLGAKENFAAWGRLNACTGEPVQNVPGNNCETYENCKDGAKVTLCSLNIDHNEGDPQMGWAFLKQFSLP